MIHVAPRHKLLAVPAIPAVTMQFPSAQVVPFEGQSALIPHGLNEVRLLRAMGFSDVPAPVLHHYHWPHPPNEPPFDVQRKTVAMMTTNSRGYVLNDKGTGKTRCAFWAFDYLRTVKLARRMLVVAPLSTLEFTWARDAFKLMPWLSVEVLHGTKEKRLKRLAAEHDVYVINPDGLEVILDDLVKRQDIDVVVVDELTAFKNNRSKKNTVLRKLLQGRAWAWGMTGSPTPESPEDAYGQCMAITPDTVPRRFTHFRDSVMTKISQFKYAARPDAKDIVLRAMQPAVRYTLDDVVELPEVVMRDVDLPLGKKQKEIYEALRTEAFAKVDTGEINAVNAGAVLIKMLQISTGYIYAMAPGATERHVVTLDNDPRLDQLEQDIGECEQKCIVFAPFIHTLAGISERMTKAGIEHAVVSGDTPGAERNRIYNLFQNTDKFKCLLAHPQCMAHGITLTRADTIIWFGPVTSLEIFEQANARIRRVGQKHRQLVLMYQSTKAERTIYQKLRSKQKMQDSVLAMFAGNQL